MTRGNGKFTNSRTGHAELIGIYCGEVIASGRRHRHCTLCNTKSPEDHECHANWTGSSKAMEADIVTGLVANLKGARVTVLVGDEDSSTMAKIREVVPWQVLKVTDVVHAKKNFGSALFAARHKLLTPKIIEYLKDCMSYALHQNQDRPDDVRSAIMNIPSHVFNDHSNCGMWCRFKREPGTYKHKRLPEVWAGSEDNKQSLKNVITTICEKFAAKAKSLAPCLSSNVNESFNFVVTTFAPKNRHYAGTQSIDRRIDGAVLQKNKGVQYIMDVNRELHLSPGDHTEKHRMAVAVQRKRRSEKSKLPEEKVKRRKSFKLLVSEQARKESAEGVQYKSAMGFSSVSGKDVAEQGIDTRQQIDPIVDSHVDTQQQLDPFDDSRDTTQQQLDPAIVISEANNNNKIARRKRLVPDGTAPMNRIVANVDFAIVVFDTETTGLSCMDEIVQLAAQSTESRFNGYCCPSVKFNTKASSVNKLACRANKLYQGGQLVKTVTKRELLLDFLQFLEGHGKRILLVAHKADFDLRILWSELKAQDLIDQFLAQFLGYCDSINFFKSKLPELSSYTLGSVCKHLMGADFTFKEHDASGDVDALSKSLEIAGFGNEEGIKFSNSSQYYVQHLDEMKKVRHLVRSLAEKSAKLTDATVKSLINNNLGFSELAELSKDKVEFVRVVEKCFKQRAATRCESIYVLFSSFNKN
jgi:DNA polymerase III epsilon subunit-like protein